MLNLCTLFMLQWLFYQKITELTESDVLLKNSRCTHSDYCAEMTSKNTILTNKHN